VLKEEWGNPRKRQSLLHEYTSEQILILFWWGERKKNKKYSTRPCDIYQDVATRLKVSESLIRRVVKKHYNCRSQRIEAYFLRKIKIPWNIYNWQTIKQYYFINYNLYHNKRLHRLKKLTWKL